MVRVAPRLEGTRRQAIALVPGEGLAALFEYCPRISQLNQDVNETFRVAAECAGIGERASDAVKQASRAKSTEKCFGRPSRGANIRKCIVPVNCAERA